jgi:hypothetical protein
VKGILNLIAMSAGGWVGWVVGARLSVFTAFIVSVVGTGMGLYAAQRFTRRMLP